MTTKAMSTMEAITGGPLTLGKTIRSIRLCGGYKQGEFAKKLKVTQSYLSDLENDRKKVSIQKALEFAHILKQSKKQFVRLAMQDTLRRQGINYDIDVRDAA